MFCALVAGKIPARKVFEDGDHIAFFPLKHFNPGHVLLIPRQHADYVFDMDDGAYHALWTTARRLAPVIKTVSGAKRVGILVEGFSVPHVHVHLVPVNALADIDPARERTIPEELAAQLADAMRSELVRS